MKKIILFANESCPYCQRVLSALRKNHLKFEFVEVPMDRSQRPGVQWQGRTYAELFDNNISIPKMIIVENSEQKILLESQNMIDHFSK